MSLKKPWAKPFRALLEEFAGLCGGQVEEPDFPEATTYRYASANTYTYPTLTSIFGSLPVHFEISESPVGSLRTGSSDLEYLRLFVKTPTRYHMIIRQERLSRKFLKLLGLEREFQTGNDVFDRRYFLVVKSEVDCGLLRLTSFQQSIEQLEPFESVEILPEGIRWSQEIRRKSQLKYSTLKEHVQRLVNLAKKLQQPVSR